MLATLEQARAAHLAADLDTAEAAYRALLHPDAVEALHGLGLLHLARDDPEAALTLIEAAHRLAPEGRSAHNLSIVLRRLGRHEAAIAREREAVAQYPDYVPAWFGLADLLAESGRARMPARCWSPSPTGRCGPATMTWCARQPTGWWRSTPTTPRCCGWQTCCTWRAGDDDARRVLAIRLRAAPDDIGAGLTQAMAQLTRVHADEAELTRRRAGLCGGTGTGRRAGGPGHTSKRWPQAAAVIGLAQPFLLSYHGQNDRELQRCYGGIVDRLAAAQGFRPAVTAAAASRGRRSASGSRRRICTCTRCRRRMAVGSPSSTARASPCSATSSARRSDAVSERLAACCDRFRARHGRRRHLARAHPGRRAARADLSRYRHGADGGAAGGAAAGAGAVHDLGASGHVGPAGDGLLPVERGDGAARRRRALYRAPGAAAQPRHPLHAAGRMRAA